MLRIDALRSVYDRLHDCVVVTIMGRRRGRAAVARTPPELLLPAARDGTGQLDGAGHCAFAPRAAVVVFDGDGSVLMNLGGFTTLARYCPSNLVTRPVRQ